MGTVNTGASNAGPWGAGHDGAEAFLVGGGIAPIAAAAFMIRDGDMLRRDITSHFMPRGKGDRPQVLSPGTRNLAFIGQFVELPQDVVFTVEYSVRSAQVAVYGLLGLQREAPAVHQGKLDPRVLLIAFRALHDCGHERGLG